MEIATIKNWATTDIKIANAYVEKCKLFVENNEAFKNFRRDLDYGKILEGNEQIVGEVAIETLKQFDGLEFVKEYLDEFIKNDKVGNPDTFDWSIGKTEIAPSTLRYINTVWEIKRWLGEFKPKRILEIGGGYGGLCRILSVIYDFENYTNIDLRESEALFDKYLSYFPELNNRTNHKVEGKYDLFIADSSLSECDTETQLRYGNLAKECDYIYFTYNTLHIDGMEENLDMLKRLFKDFEGIRIAPLNVEGREVRFSVTYCLKRKEFMV